MKKIDNISDSILNADTGETIRVDTHNRSGMELTIEEMHSSPPAVVVKFGYPPNHMRIHLGNGERPRITGPLIKDVAQEYGFDGEVSHVDGKEYIEFTEEITNVTRVERDD